ncbi:hypothetical protein [Azotobacter armeniacus]
MLKDVNQIDVCLERWRFTQDNAYNSSSSQDICFFHPRYATLVFSLPFGLFAVGFIARLFDSQHRLKNNAHALTPS